MQNQQRTVCKGNISMDVNGFSDRQLAGQRLMVGFDGTRLDANLEHLITDLGVGGLILFSRNLIDPDQIRGLCSDAQALARLQGQPPLMIAIDQEGGPVARLKAPFTRFAGQPAIGTPAQAAHFACVTAAELRSVGINMNMSPVLDVAPQGVDSIMAARSFGADPDRVALLGRTLIRHLQANGVMAVAKHFPGIGRTVMDSHLEQPRLDVDPEELMADDLRPFEAAGVEGVAGIMLAHILYPQLDSHWPASLSPRIAVDLLRTRMSYGGLVITDDLDMGAIKPRFDIQTVVRQVLAARVDIALICHQGPDIAAAHRIITAEIGASRDLRVQAQTAAARILAFKQSYLA